MSMPGTPVLYYGDEIGMGDNIYLGDRDAVRTPMQWSSDRNAGFSRANPQKLLLPVNIEPGSHYESINVETQRENPSSLLRWMKQLIALRKRHPVLARGEIEFLQPENGKVLAFIRHDDDEDFLVVANLSRFSQPVELDLSRFRGRTPTEVFGYTPFPRIGELPYLLTLGPHSFYWFSIGRDESQGRSDTDEPELLEVTTDPAAWLKSQNLKRWAAKSLPAILPTRRWFAGKSRTIREVSIDDTIPLGPIADGVADSLIALVTVAYTTGDDETYTLPLALVNAERAQSQGVTDRGSALATIAKRNSDAPRLTLINADADEAFWATARDILVRRKTVKGGQGSLCGVVVQGQGKANPAEKDAVRIPRVEQSNSSAVLGGAAIMKLFRRVEPGINPDYEIGSHLTRSKLFQHTPATHGAIEYRRGRDTVITLMTKQELVQNDGDAWAHALDAVGRYYERATARPVESRGKAPSAPRSAQLPERMPTDDEATLLNGYPDNAHLLGQRTAEMHDALASSIEPDFEPDEMSKLYLRALYQTLRNGVRRPLQSLKAGANKLEGDNRELAERVLARRDELIDRIAAVRDLPLEGRRIRCHGDYHLGQVLWTGADFYIIDFEGEPMRTLGERRLKRSPLTDVAGMCRSLDYAAHAGLSRLESQGLADEPDQLRQMAERWSELTRAAFLRGYLEHAREDLIPKSRDALGTLLDAWILHKAAYEVEYELNNRPDWVAIPLRGILGVLGDNGPA
jgi:maltose alpha-D-glucosyltransferase/alpha-amylase